MVSLKLIAEKMLAEIQNGGEAAALNYAKKLDGWTGDVVLAGQPFQTTMGAYTSPPIHPNCRCQLHELKSTP